MSLTEVSSILWRERELLELLVFKLEEEQLLLANGRARWLTHATREVEMVLGEIKRSELGRAVEVDAVASALGLPAGLSLRELAESVPAPWNDILRQHREAFLALTDEISTLARTNKELLGAGFRTARETLLSLGEQDVTTYTPDGQSVSKNRGPRLLNQAI
jgi:hypothetical protein